MDLFEKQKIPNVYDSIQYLNYEQIDNLSTRDKSVIPDFIKPYSISLIPAYLDLKVLHSEKFAIETIEQTNSGYAILFNSEFNIDIYLKNQFKSNYRNLKKRLIRLEECFNISYKFFYGKITEEHYSFIMESLRVMLIHRFRQRKEENKKLEQWNELVSNTYGQIITKKASLFVIYEEDFPIDISLNYHFDKIMFGAVSSYSIEYSKFGIGFIEKIKLMEWCISNGYKILEFGYGNLEYKKKWSNHLYSYKSHVIYNRNSILSMVIAKTEILKLSVKELLKTYKIDVFLKKLKSGVFNNIIEESFIYNNIDYKKDTLNDLSSYGEIRKVEVHPESPFHLKLIVNDFLYSNVEHRSNISVHEVVSNPGTYLIAGRKTKQVFFLETNVSD